MTDKNWCKTRRKMQAFSQQTLSFQISDVNLFSASCNICQNSESFQMCIKYGNLWRIEDLEIL